MSEQGLDKTAWKLNNVDLELSRAQAMLSEEGLFGLVGKLAEVRQAIAAQMIVVQKLQKRNK